MQIELNGARLRPWRTSDLDDLVLAANNPNVARTLRDLFPHPYTRADAETWLARAARTDEPDIKLCIEVDGRAAGGIGIHPQKDVNRVTAELGYWLGEPFWGRGIMTQVVRAVVAQAFARLPLERIEAFAFANNPASPRVLEKAGFTREGYLRRNVIKHGEVLDSFLYAILRTEAASR